MKNKMSDPMELTEAIRVQVLQVSWFILLKLMFIDDLGTYHIAYPKLLL